MASCTGVVAIFKTDPGMLGEGVTGDMPAEEVLEASLPCQHTAQLDKNPVQVLVCVTRVAGALVPDSDQTHDCFWSGHSQAGNTYAR